jgi:hypothetical protein
MPADKPIMFRAIHTTTLWRKARHENIYNAISGSRGASALFRGANTAIKLKIHGEAIFVVVWDERTQEAGFLIKRDASTSDGMRQVSLPRHIIEVWHDMGGPGIEEAERVFQEVWDAAQKQPVLLRNEAFATFDDLNEQLQRDILESRNSSAEDRNRRLATANPIPERVRVITTAFRRNADVIVKVLDRAQGICERCGSAAPFNRRTDGAPYLEVHHKIPLSQGGHDTVSNAEALCPNCHRNKHFGPAP